MKFRPTEFLNTPYRVSCYIKLYRKLFSVMRPIVLRVPALGFSGSTSRSSSRSLAAVATLLMKSGSEYCRF